MDTWLNNARKRYNYPSTNLNPLDIYLSGSSEDKAIGLEAIAKAAESFPKYQGFEGTSSRERHGACSSASSFGSAFDDCGEARLGGAPRQGRKKFAYSRSSSVGSLARANSDLNNNRKVEPSMVIQDWDSEKAAAREASPKEEKKGAAPSDEWKSPNLYQCTFCWKRMSSKSWKRHEESQHLPRRKWTCMPLDEACFGVDHSCVFCQEIGITSSHNTTVS